MNKKLLLSFLISASLPCFAQKQSVVIQPVSPIEYKSEKGTLKVLNYVKLPKKVNARLSATLDGVSIEVMPTNKGDSLLVWLPMIGESNHLQIHAGKIQWVDQSVYPMIPKDWGYFQQGTIHLIQSSHQDIAWMDTPDYCKDDRINNIIIPALDLMKKNKSFTFEMEQTLNLMEFLNEHPERKGELIDLYKEKRFLWGATFNQPYEGLSSGEQLVRQSYYGRKWIRENMPGCDDIVANNIDVPGRTWQMAQILAKSGIKNLFISRMGEGLYDWYSPDGSKVLTFTPGNYGWASMIWKFFDDDAVTAFHKLHHRSVLWSDYYRKHNIPPHYAILMSCDGTKPVDFQPIIDEWNKIASQSATPLPKLKNSTAEEFFELVSAGNASFEKVEGERPDLWLYIHGPAHYEATLFKREAGILLPAAETFTTFSKLNKNDLSSYPRSSFDRAWMASIYPDHGLGGKNGDITDRIFEDSLRVARDLGASLLKNALGDLSASINTKKNNYIVFNDLTWERSEYVQVEVKNANVAVYDAKGILIPSQVSPSEKGKNVVTFRADKIPSMGYASFEIAEGKKTKNQQSAVKVSANTVENNYYKAHLGNGGIVSLFDKELNKELVVAEKFACGDVIEAGYTGNGAGEFTQITPLTPGDIKSLISYTANWRMTENGALFTRFINSQPTEHATIHQIITFYHTKKKIDFDVELENFDGAHNRQYRIAFPLNMMEERKVHYEVPMGVAQVGKDEMKTIPKGWAWGGTYSNHPADTHPREIQNFISASGNGFGVTMSSCVAVADWIDPSREEAKYPVLQGILLSSHKSCHGEGNWYHQTGTHRFHFSLFSHKEGWVNGYASGIEANHPLLISRKLSTGGTLNASHSFLSISDPLVSLSLVKKADADNHLIIRLTEMEGKDKTVQITLPADVKKVVRTNLIEDEIETIPGNGNVISVFLGHHAIETFKLIL